MHETSNQLAAALREKKKELFIPTRESNDYLVKEIGFTLFHIVNGDWKALQRKEPEKLSLSQLQRPIVKYLRKTVSAGLPLLVILAFLKTPLAPTGALHDYLLFGSIIWVLLNLLVEVDPEFTKKLEALKEIKDGLLSNK